MSARCSRCRAVLPDAPGARCQSCRLMGKVAAVAGGLVLGAVLVLVVPAWLRHDHVARNDALFVGGLGAALLALGGVFLLFPGRAR